MGKLFRRHKDKPTYTAPQPDAPAAVPEVTLSDVLAKVEALEAKLNSENNPLAGHADRLIEAGDRLASLLDVSRARHPELGLESVLEMSGLSRGTHYVEAEEGYVLKLPGGRDYHIATVPVDKLVDDRDTDGFAGIVREALGKVEILLFPEYALAELLSKHPELVSEAAKSSTVLGTPSTILAMLEWVRAEWRYTDRVGELGKVAGDMSKAIRGFASRYAEVGKRLNGTRIAYNGSLGPWGEIERTVGLAAHATGDTLENPEKVQE